MIATALNVLLDSLNENDQEEFIEAVCVLPEALKILKALEYTNRGIDEFNNIYETTVARLGRYLEVLGMVDDVWERRPPNAMIRRYRITEFGRRILNIIEMKK